MKPSLKLKEETARMWEKSDHRHDVFVVGDDSKSWME